MTRQPRRPRWWAIAALAAAIVLAADRWIATTDLPDLTPATSATTLDRNGALLRAWTADGRWRLPLTAAQTDPNYLALLIASEDRRFRHHPGVDPLALLRAAGQALRHGRVVSGASTLTMQTARLLEQGPTGDPTGKLRQIRLALALERKLTKDEILALYLTLAPFGGNLEGARAASLAYFGKEPRRLSPAESALLVALPQAPETRRPDRHPETARKARDRVLARAAATGALSQADAAAAQNHPVPLSRRPFPALAPHLTDRLRAPSLTLDATLQSSLETLLHDRARALGPSLSAALIVADHRTGEILAQIGSPDRLDPARRGFVDMTRATRSPGSTLKPLIYGLAFDAGLAHPETIIEDRPMTFGAYAPQNLDRTWAGAMTLRAALQASRNLPAVALLDAVGPAQLLARLRRAGVTATLPDGRAPGLAIALGGLGLTLEDLATLYAAIARGGEAISLSATGPGAPLGRLLSPVAAWQTADILRGAPTPANAAPGTIAFKTGTSYGHRDAVAVGFDGAHVVAVWFGRADGAAMPGVLGVDVAAPVLFDAFARLKPTPTPFPPPPPATLTLATNALPRHLRRFHPRGQPTAPGPAIAFPPDGARLAHDGGPLVVRVGAGSPPFRWLVDGTPLAASPFDRQAEWTPDGAGFVTLAVVDATGAAARATVFVEPNPAAPFTAR